MALALSRYVVVDPVAGGGETAPELLVYATRTGSVRVVSSGLWGDVSSGRWDAIPEKILADLVDIEALVNADEDELDVLLRRNEAAAADTDQLYLVVQPTASCQLGCGYCGQQHRTRLLTQDDQRLVAERLRTRLESRKYRSVYVGWFGAEPLSGLPVIRTMTPALQQLAHEFGCTYGARLVTNGVALNSHIAQELTSSLGVDHVELTLDGVPAYHDRRRPFKTGKSSFELIFENLLELARVAPSSVRISVRCNVDASNRDGVSPLIAMLAAHGLQKRVEFYVARVHDWGNSAGSAAPDAVAFAIWEVAWLREQLAHGFTPRLVPQRTEILCLAMMPAGELVDAFGKLYNCTEVSYVPAYEEPDGGNVFAIGTLRDGEAPGRRARLSRFYDDVRDRAFPCSTCEMLPVCGGGCPKSWQEGNLPCPTAKHNIADRLRLNLELQRTRKRAPRALAPLVAAAPSHSPEPTERIATAIIAGVRGGTLASDGATGEFQQVLDRTLMARLCRDDYLTFLGMSHLAKQALREARAGRLLVAETLLAEGKQLLERGAQAADLRVVASLVWGAAHAYLLYRQKQFDTTIERLVELLILAEKQTCSEVYGFLHAHRIQLGHNVMRVHAAHGQVEQAVIIGAALLNHLAGRESDTTLPGCWDASLLLLPLSQELVRALQVQIASELAVVLRRCGPPLARRLSEHHLHPAKIAADAMPPSVASWLDLHRRLLSEEAPLDLIEQHMVRFRDEAPVIWQVVAAETLDLFDRLGSTPRELLDPRLRSFLRDPSSSKHLTARRT